MLAGFQGAYLQLLRARHDELGVFAAAFEQCGLSMAITDAEGIFKYVNPRFTAETGWSIADLRGKTPRVLSSGLQSKDFYRDLWATIQAGEPWHGELWNRRRDGDLMCERLSISPLLRGGRITHFVAAFQDTTRQKRSEEALQAATEAARAANLSKSMFIANMSHEIRTPMTAILGMTDLLRRDPRVRGEHLRDLASIADNGERLLALISDILEMSEIEAGRSVADPAPFPLGALLDNLAERFGARAGAKGLAFHLQRDPDLPQRTVADAHKLQHVLVSLLDNAVKFTERGQINALVRLEPGRALRLAVAVEDSGPGMEAHEISGIFEAFSQTRPQRNLAGTGLGLAISRAYVRLMGGELTVASQVGRGTLFQFSIPLREAPPEPAAVTPPPLADASAALRVLIVDDEPAIRAFVRQALERPGIEVEEAASGEEALMRAEAAPPDLVFMDQNLGGIDGLEATRRLKARAGDAIRVVLASGTRYSGQRPAGPDHFITKPYGEVELTVAIRRTLGQRLAPAPTAAVPPPAPPLTSADLLGLPPEIQIKLRTAAALLDLDLVGRVAADLEPIAPLVAAAVSDLVRRCDLQRLNDLFSLEEAVS